MKTDALIKRLEPVYQPLALALTVFLLGTLTFSLWRLAQDRVETEARLQFDNRAKKVTEAIYTRMIDYEQLLRGCAAFFAASKVVDRGEWRDYVAALAIEKNYPGIQGVAYAQHVSYAGLAKHEAALRAEGFAGYTVRPSGERAEYTPTIYIEPFDERNRRSFGYDSFSESARRAAMAQARDSADIAISDRITLVQETKRDIQPGFLMYLPVYANRVNTATPQARLAALAGYVYIPFRANDLMRHMLEEFNDLRVQIHDGPDNDAATLLFDSATSAPPNLPWFNVSHVITIHSHAWAIRVSSMPAFEKNIDRSTPLIVLGAGAAISLLLLIVIGSLGTMRSRAATLARHMTIELRESREQLSLALEGSELAFFDWNVTTDKVNLSSRWMAMLGGEPQASTTTSAELFLLIHPDDILHVQNTLRPVLRGDAIIYAIEHRVRGRSGEWIWILSRAKVAARDESGRALRVTGTNANITARKQVEQLKDEFIATVNHELRTPLTVIVGSLALLKEELSAATPDQAMMLDMACQNSARLQSLVNDILDLEKIAAGAMQFEISPVALGAFLRKALEQNRVYADRFHVGYELRGPLPKVCIAADAARLMQVMTNLLSNAAKFSPTGEAIIIAATVTDERVRVAVSDRGPGIPLEFRDRIFGKFAQADGSSTRQHGGSGLGLSICKAMIEKMGGQIGFDSVPGQGATFYFELPTSAAESAS